MHAHPLPDEPESPLVLGDVEQLHGAALTGAEAAHPLDHVQHELGVLGQALAAVGGPPLAHVLGQPCGPC